MGHAGGCNPFSPNPFMLAVKSATLPEQQKANITKATEKDFVIRDGDIQCFWCGVHGRCILRLGHFPDVSPKEPQVPQGIK